MPAEAADYRRLRFESLETRNLLSVTVVYEQPPMEPMPPAVKADATQPAHDDQSDPSHSTGNDSAESGAELNGLSPSGQPQGSMPSGYAGQAAGSGDPSMNSDARGGALGTSGGRPDFLGSSPTMGMPLGGDLSAFKGQDAALARFGAPDHDDAPAPEVFGNPVSGASARPFFTALPSVPAIVMQWSMDSGNDAQRARVLIHESGTTAFASPEGNAQTEAHATVSNPTLLQAVPGNGPVLGATQSIPPAEAVVQAASGLLDAWGLVRHDESQPAAANPPATADCSGAESPADYERMLVDASLDLMRSASGVLAPESVRLLANLPFDVKAIDAAMDDLLTELATFEGGLVDWLGEQSPASLGAAAAGVAIFAIGGRQLYIARNRRSRSDEAEQASLSRLFARVHGFGLDRS